MAYGVYNVSTNNQYISGRVEWVSESDVNNNQSTVTAILYLSRTNTGYTTWGSGTFYLTINGNQKTNSQQYSLTYNSNTVMVSHTVVVPHNADGSKAITISASGSISGAGVSMSTQSGTATLDTIPRASKISSFPSFAIGDSVNISISRASASFTHKIHLYSGNTFIAERTGIGDSYTLTLTSDEQDKIYATIPNSTSALLTLFCKTFNGASEIGDWTSVGGVATVKSTVVPTFTTITATENVSLVNTTVGKFVQGLSKLNMAITGSAGAKYSTISSYEITFDGTTYNSSSATSSVIKGTGTLTITGKITDSRGRVATKSITVSVLPYSMPSITEFSLLRCNIDGTPNELGTYVKVVSKGSVSSLLNSTEKNNLTYTIYSKARTISTWTSKKTGTIVGLTLNVSDIVGTYVATDSFDFRLDIKDKFNTTLSLNVLPTGLVTMSWNKNGIGVGKIWQQGALDVGGDIYENDVKLADKYLCGSNNTLTNSGVTDFNTIWKSGFYDGSSGLNNPFGAGNWAWILNIAHSSARSDYKIGGQIAINNSPTANPRMCFRTTDATGAGNWVALAMQELHANNVDKPMIMKVTDGGGAGMFATLGTYFWWAVDNGAPYSVICGFAVKQTAGASAVCYVMHSNGLSLGASNSVGTQNINGGAAANIRFCSIRVNSY